MLGTGLGEHPLKKASGAFSQPVAVDRDDDVPGSAR
jgi:hypothetical protein